MHIAFLAHADNIHAGRWADFLVSRGHKLTLLCDPPVHSPPRGVRLIHPEMRLVTKVLAFRLFPKPYGNNFYKRFPYRRELNRLKPDLVHGFEALGYGYALAHAGPFPKVLTPFGNDILHDPKKSRIARFLVTTALKKADIITTNYLELAETLTRIYGTPQSKIRPFSWGVDCNIFKPGYREETRRLRSELDIPTDARVILSNRVMKPYWGIETIARALPAVFREIPGAFAVFLRGTGDPSYEEKIRNILGKEKALERVRFVDRFLSPLEMAHYLNLAECFVSCPRTDLLSISLLEGMACGCVPVTSKLESYKKRITHGENGLFFRGGDPDELAEQLVKILRHPEWISSFREKNVRLIGEKDDWNKNALILESIYKDLVKKSGYPGSGER